jgi:hypothetical protein
VAQFARLAFQSPYGCDPRMFELAPQWLIVRENVIIEHGELG